MTAAEVRRARAASLADVRGANYLPSWSRSSYDAWGPGMDRAQLARELGYARRLGLQAVRVWLALEQGEALDGFLGRVRALLDAAHTRGLGVVLVLFDSCGCEYDEQAPQVGMAEVPGLCVTDPRWPTMLQWAGDRELVGPYELADTPWVGDPMAVIWNTWRPMPAYRRLVDPMRRAELSDYVEAVLGLARTHPALRAVELINEPFLSPSAQGRDLAPIVQLYVDAYETARRVAPEVPLAVGAANAADAALHDDNLGGELDLVSVHCYGGADELGAEIAACRELGGQRPVVLSEWGCFPGLPDDGQDQVYRERTAALDRLGVGWFAFHLVAGYGPFALSALLYPNGTMRPAARFLRGHLAATAGRP